MDTIVIEIKFIDEQIGNEVDARMESGDNQQHIRVIGRGGIVVLDADCLGDWNIQFHIGSFFNPTSGLPFQRHLCQQRCNFGTLIEIFGPNQFVLVATSGTLLSPPRPQIYLPRRHCTGAYIYLTFVDR